MIGWLLDLLLRRRPRQLWVCMICGREQTLDELHADGMCRCGAPVRRLTT